MEEKDTKRERESPVYHISRPVCTALSPHHTLLTIPCYTVIFYFFFLSKSQFLFQSISRGIGGLGMRWESKVYPGVERRKAKPNQIEGCVCVYPGGVGAPRPALSQTYSRLARLLYLRNLGVRAAYLSCVRYLIPSLSSWSTQLL